MTFNFFKKPAHLDTTQTPAAMVRTMSIAQPPRRERLARKTKVMALAAHIGQAGQKSRIGLPNWSA